jgi:vancomycin aglycone glucosyltransferase
LPQAGSSRDHEAAPPVRVPLPGSQCGVGNGRTIARTQGRRVLLGSGWADLVLIDDRDDCFVVGEVNHQALFRRVAAVVHHGGAGTTTTAALAGAPQVVIPPIVDQPHWARRVAELGLGANAGPTFEALSGGLATALKPETRGHATAVAGTIRTDGATVAAQMLLDGVG